MKENNSGKQVSQDMAPQPEKTGWIRKFCGKGIFREIWKNRFVVLKGDQLFISEKEVKEGGRADEVLDLLDYKGCEEVKKKKNRSKKNHSKFRLQGTTAPDLLFLAISPQDKESWINTLNGAITRRKNKVLDEVTVDDVQLFHPTRDRAKILHNRRLPTRGHLLAVASSSDGALDAASLSPISSGLTVISVGTLGKSRSLPRGAVLPAWEEPEKNRCVSMNEIQTHSPPSPPATSSPSSGAAPIDRLQELIGLKLQATQRLLARAEGVPGGPTASAEELLREAAAAWNQAHEVLEEVRELRALHRQLAFT